MPKKEKTMPKKEKKGSKGKGVQKFSEHGDTPETGRRASGSKKGPDPGATFFDATLPRQKKKAPPAAASPPAGEPAKGRGRGRGRGRGSGRGKPTGNGAAPPAGDGGGMNRARKGSVMWPSQQPGQVSPPPAAAGGTANPSNTHVHLTSIASGVTHHQRPLLPPHLGPSSYYRPTRPVGKSQLTRDKGSRAAWDVGKVSRGECEHGVLAAESGDFLVRHGSDGKSYVICVNDSNQTVHNFKASVQADGKILFNNKPFDCLEDGIENLRRQPLSLPSGRTVYLAKSASHCKWFVGAMERLECGRLLMAAGNCDYLVRLQVTGERAEYEICINDKGHLARCSIMRSRAGDFVTAQGDFFPSLGELLNHARDGAVFTGESGRNLFIRRVAAAADWYCGKMSRERVEKVVGKSETGSYLVRQSEKKPDDFVLVVKSATVVMSYKIVRSDVGFTIRGDTYASMESVIRQIHKNPLQNADGSPLQLTKPAQRPNDKVNIVGEVELDSSKRISAVQQQPSMAGASKEVVAMEEMMKLAEQKLQDAGGFDDAEEDGGFGGHEETAEEGGTTGGETEFGAKLNSPFRGVTVTNVSMDDAEAMGAKFLAVEANQPLFVFAEGDGTWGAVYQGTAGRISKDNVKVETDEMASERRTAQLDEAVAGFDDDANELDDSDEEEDEEEEDAAEVDEEPEEAPSNGFAEEDFIDHEAASAAAAADTVAADAAAVAAKEAERLMAEIAAMDDDEMAGFD